MQDIKVGSIVSIKDKGDVYPFYAGWLKDNHPEGVFSWQKGKDPSLSEVYKVVCLAEHDSNACVPIAFVVSVTTGQGFIMGVEEGLELVKNKTPRKTNKGSVNRQFDVNFKISIVRQANQIKRNGQHGQLKLLLQTHQLADAHLYYWRKQFNQGHFASERAVAFSRKDTMIHG